MSTTDIHSRGGVDVATDVTLNELHTFIVGLLALGAGEVLYRKISLLERLGVPAPVVGGVLAAVVVAVLRSVAGIEVEFATGTRDVLLLVFFTAVGLSAKISALRIGGKPLAILCGVTVLVLVVQNLVGVCIALIKGVHPFYGLLVGSLSFVGGTGTAIAWANEGQAMGLEFAPVVALGAATMAVVAGSLVAAPVTVWFIRRRGLATSGTDAKIPWQEPGNQRDERPEATTIQILQGLLLISLAVAGGDSINDWARGAGVLLPGFLTCMLAGVVIANLSDLLRVRLVTRPVERAGTISLQLFLALSLMTLQLWTMAAAVGPLLLTVVIQVTLTTLIAFVVLFPLLGRSYDSAVTAGGFIGFGIAAMPVAFASMEEVTGRFGPSQRAFLLITLAGSFFVDIANAAVTKGFLALPIFR
jgi:ESS family glutamate:Na+ symporter